MLNLVPFKRLKNISSSYLSKIIKLDISRNRAYFEFGLKGGSNQTQSSSQNCINPLSDPLETSLANIVWVDEKVFNSENTTYFENTPKNFVIKRFNCLSDAIPYINSYKSNKITVMVSGSLGKDLISKLKFEYISAIIIFCMNVHFHRNWSKKYDIIHAVFNTFSDVVNFINHNCLTKIKDERHVLYTSSEYKSLYCLMNEISPNILNIDNVTNELIQIRLDKKDNIIAHLPSLESLEQLENSSARQNKLAKAIIYLYTTNIIYKEFNNTFKRNEFHKVAVSNALCYREFMNDESFRFKGNVLYRGIKCKDLSEYKIAKQKGIPIFFPGFLSVSQKKNIAKSFSTSTGISDCNGILFEIEMNEEKPFHHIKLTEEMSQFNTEEEVILMSHAPFYVDKVDEVNRIISLKQFKYLEVVLHFEHSIENIKIEDFFLVKDIKRVIKLKTGIPIQYQVLHFNTIILEDDKALKDYTENTDKININLTRKFYGCYQHILYLKAIKISASEFLLKGNDFNGYIIEKIISGNATLEKIEKKLAKNFQDLCDPILTYEGKEIRFATINSLMKNNKSIIILYVSQIFKVNVHLTNHKFAFELKYSDKVKIIKDKIQNEQGIMIEELKFGEIKLNYEKSIRDYDLKYGCILNGSYDFINIFISTESYNRILLNTKPSKLIKEIKLEIEEKEGIPSYKQNIYYNVEKLENDKTLAYYNIKNDFTISLIVKSGEIRIEINTINGIVITLYVELLYTIMNVKREIREKLGFPEGEQSLIFKGKKLENTKTLEDYRILQNDKLNLVLNLKGGMQIFLKMFNDEDIVIDTQSSNSIENVKLQFKFKEDISVYEQKIFFKGKKLKNNKTLEHYNIKPECFLQIKFPLVKYSELKNQLNEINSLDDYFGSRSFMTKLTKKAFSTLEKSNISSDKILKSQFPNDNKITIKMFSGKSLKIKTGINEEVKNLKENIEKKYCIPFCEQILMLHGTPLNDNKQINFHKKKYFELHLFPLFQFQRRPTGINAYINKHHIDSIENLAHLIELEGYDLPPNFKIFHKGNLIKKLDELPNCLSFIYIDMNNDNEPYSDLQNEPNLYLCKECSNKSKHITPCSDFQNKSDLFLYKNYSSPKMDKTEPIIEKEGIKVKALALLNTHENQGKIKWYKYCGDSLIYQSNNTVYLLQKNCVHLQNINALVFYEGSIIDVVKNNRILLYLNDEILYVKKFDYNGFLLEEKHKKFKQAKSLICANNILVILDKKFNFKVFTLFPLKFQFKLTDKRKVVYCLEIFSNGKYLFSSHYEIIKMWSLENKNLEFCFSGHDSLVTCMRVNSSNNMLFSGSGDGTIIAWDIENLSIKHRIEAHRMEIRGIAISDNDQYLVSGGNDWQLKVWDLKNYELVASVQEKSWVNFVEISQDCRYIYTGLNNGTINCHELVNGT